MPRKRLEDDDPRRKRRSMTLQQKGLVLGMLDRNMKIVDVASAFRVNESTIRTIRKNKVKIQQSLEVAAEDTSKVAKQAGNDMLIKVDKMLASYVHRQRSAGILISREACCMKAREYLDEISRRMDAPPPYRFKASKAWAQGFFRRHGFHHRKKDQCKELLNSETVSASDYPDTISKVIENDGYSLDQVFNVGKTAFYWKKMPIPSCSSKDSKHSQSIKSFKNRITVLLGCNASGTWKLKPLVLHTSKSPKMYENFDFDKLGVYWRTNNRALLNRTIMCDWFDNMFVPEVRAFCRRQNKDFKCLLLVNNAHGQHSSLLLNRHPKIKVELLPDQATSLMQPLDQELISQLKARYYTRIFKLLDRANGLLVGDFFDLSFDADGDQTMAGSSNSPTTLGLTNILKFWKNFSMKDAIDNLITAWDDVTVASICHAWQSSLGDRRDEDILANIEEVDRQVAEAVAIARRLPGFDGVTTEEVMDMLGNQQPELSVEVTTVEEADDGEEMMEAAKDARRSEGETDSAETTEPAPLPLRTTDMQDLLSMGSELKDEFLELDDNIDQTAECTLMAQVLEPYNTLFSHFLSATRQQDAIIHNVQKSTEDNQPSTPGTEEKHNVKEILTATKEDKVLS